MINIPELLAEEFNIKDWQVANTLALFNEGATVPFIARYRKERTGELDEVVIRDLHERLTYLNELEERKQAILKSIEEQGKLSEELQQKIEATLQKSELEDIYLPYKPKRRTRATIAREKGLEPLAEAIAALNESGEEADLYALAAEYVKDEVKDADEALQGASDILAEAVAETADYRAWIRDFLSEESRFVSRIKDEHEEGSTKYEMYREYESSVKDIPAHNMLALRRGESEGILFVDMEFDEGSVLAYLFEEEIETQAPTVRSFYEKMIADAFNRLMKLSLTAEIRLACKQKADEESIETFEANLRELLLSSPAGMKPTLGIDPGFRTGCKIAALDSTGKFVENQTMYPHGSDRQQFEAEAILKAMIERHNVELIAVGNGTAGRETLDFVKKVTATLPKMTISVMVNESGASIYSASDVAREEFPELDLTVRGAISIGRRLQDPLAELVKIDPKSIGVGQYQHDVDQSLLKRKLEETVESCVNYVGVDLNTASTELLKFVSGISSRTAKNIIKWRDENGVFKNRKQLLKVSMFGPKAYEQAAGFLRIREGDNPLDNTAVHPERYDLVKDIASKAALDLKETKGIADHLYSNVKEYVNDEVGLPTLEDIIEELKKPGRDPRAEFSYATFKEGVNAISDLQTDMILEGVVTNVANFGAFVDIGVHQDGLVHISQLSNSFVSDPKEVVKVGQVVKVRVLEVNEKLKRISLSMKSEDSGSGGGNFQKPNRNARGQRSNQRKSNKPTPSNSLDDLRSRFNQKL